MKIEQFYNKNQFILRDYENKKTYFQSYNSMIALIDDIDNTLILGCDWDYSKTTLKHLYIFLEQELNYNFLGIQGYSLTNELSSAINKKQYINKCIEKGIIKYDGTMQ